MPEENRQVDEVTDRDVLQEEGKLFCHSRQFMHVSHAAALLGNPSYEP